MSLDKIIEKINEDARQKVEQIMLDTRKEIEQIKKKSIEDSKKMLKHMLLKAVKSGKEEIILSDRDKKLINEDWLEEVNMNLIKDRGLPGKLKLAEDTRDIKGGVILKDGQVEINSSFEAILKYNQNELESEVADLLLGKE